MIVVGLFPQKWLDHFRLLSIMIRSSFALCTSLISPCPTLIFDGELCLVTFSLFISMNLVLLGFATNIFDAMNFSIPLASSSRFVITVFVFYSLRFMLGGSAIWLRIVNFCIFSNLISIICTLLKLQNFWYFSTKLTLIKKII